MCSSDLYSPELAEAERAFLAAKADLLLAEQKLARVERLGAIGAVATQEVEDARAEHARQATAVEGARSRVRVLGVGDDAIAALKTAADITASVRVLAPSAGTIINRAVNRGQNVDAGTELVVIADLSTVWVIADVYERDMTAVTRGASARVTTTALPGRTWTGRVTYVDPQVDPATRTLKARVEVTNPGLALKPGQLVDVALGVAAALFWGLTTLVIRATRLSQAPAEKTLAYQLAVSAALFWLMVWAVGEPWPQQVSTLSWVSLFFQTVVVAFASFLTWFWLMRHYPAAKLSSFTLVTPLAGLAFGVLLLGEPLTLRLVAAAAAVALGLVLINVQTSRRPS